MGFLSSLFHIKDCASNLVCTYFGMDVYTKECNAHTAALETANCALVAPFGFSPPTITGDPLESTVVTTMGVPLDDYIETCPAADAALALQSACECLKLMHDNGMLHLDARLANFIVCTVPKNNGVHHTYADGIVRYTYAIDYESLWAPEGQDIAMFDREAKAMEKYGRLPHYAYFHLPFAYRIDVHALAESCQRQFSETEVPNRNIAGCRTIIDACQLIVNHNPQCIDGLMRNLKEHAWTEYLLDTRHPVQDIHFAIEIFKMPDLVWR